MSNAESSGSESARETCAFFDLAIRNHFNVPGTPRREDCLKVAEGFKHNPTNMIPGAACTAIAKLVFAVPKGEGGTLVPTVENQGQHPCKVIEYTETEYRRDPENINPAELMDAVIEQVTQDGYGKYVPRPQQQPPQ